MGGLTAGTWLSFITLWNRLEVTLAKSLKEICNMSSDTYSLLEEFAPQAGSQLPDFASLFSLIWFERSLTLSDTFLGSFRLARLGLLANLGLGGFSGYWAFASILSRWGR